MTGRTVTPEFRFYYFTSRYEQTIRFYRDVMQLEIYSSWDRPGGDRGTIFRSPNGAGLIEIEAGEKLPSIVGGFYVEVEDVDAWYQRLRDGGAPISREPAPTSYGHLNFKTVDPSGVEVCFFQHLATRERVGGQVEAPRLRLQGIDHVALSVRDVRRSVEWYQSVLGLERRYADVWGDFPAVVGAGSTSLALFPSPVPDPAPPPGREVLSVRHIAFRVDRRGFEQAKIQFEELGLDPRFEDHVAAHSLYITDPDGHQIEITTYDIE